MVWFRTHDTLMLKCIGQAVQGMTTTQGRMMHAERQSVHQLQLYRSSCSRDDHNTRPHDAHRETEGAPTPVAIFSQ